MLDLIAASRALGLAPTTSATFSPFLKSRKVGMARMPSSCATSGTSSTSSLKKRALGYVPDILRAGALERCLASCVCVRPIWDLLDDLGRNDLAGTAPGGEAVEDHQAGLVAESLVEGRLAGTLLADARHFCTETMTSPARVKRRNGAIVGHLRLEVVDTGVRHSGCVGEELLCEKWSV
jgi:hypothetical protein